MDLYLRDKNIYIHPYVRLYVFVATLTGIIITHNLYILTAGWLLVVCTATASGVLKKHLTFLMYGILPIFFVQMLVYVIVLPQVNPNYIIVSGMLFVSHTVLKLLLVASLFQLVLTVPDESLYTTLYSWGIKGDNMIIYFGATTIWADVKMKSNKILDARFARGLIPNRSLINRIKQIPYLIRPLIIAILHSSIERSDSWRQKKILDNIKNFENKDLKYDKKINSLILLISTTWCIICIIYNR